MPFASHRVRTRDVETISASADRLARQRHGEFARRALTSLTPALALGCLAVFQVDAAVQNGAHLVTNPSWAEAAAVVRAILYGSFTLGAAVVLSANSDPKARDGRASIVAAALAASFLLAIANLVPAGPALWVASPTMLETCLGLTVLGAALALLALTSLRSNFSIVPEARLLVSSGPYRWLRHPMYFAELMMISGIALSDSRLTLLLGAIAVVGLQICRVRAEEELLRATFPAAHSTFVTRTRYRLVPFVW